MGWFTEAETFVRRIVWKPVRTLFAAYGVLFTLSKTVTFALPGAKVFLDGDTGTRSVLLAGLAIFLYDFIKPRRVKWKVPGSNTTLEVRLGDLFEQDGLRIIPANEYFDSKLGKAVSPNTLHGMLIKEHFVGGEAAFAREVKKALLGKPFVATQRQQGPGKAYPIGTTVQISDTNGDYLLFALSRSNLAASKAETDLPQLWEALAGAWDGARNECGGSDVNMPLAGTGQSGAGLNTRDALKIVIHSATIATTKTRVTGKIRIVLHKDSWSEVDLRDVRAYWSSY
ncbi:macro domain-containing protein [Xanthomonas sp. NCPPB 2632]|uniref:macro domain-containing protein n=1 Tax=Xanthomonas sp. NCPPB 2632 TaxID=3240912 RepID=UPI0035153740